MSEVKFMWHGNLASAIAREAAKEALKDGADMILTESRDDIPVQTGTLQRSGTVKEHQEGNTLHAMVVYNTPYALGVHEGFVPHVIEARNKKVLAVPASKYKGEVHPYGSKKLPMLSKDGKFVILGRRVKHPGSKGRKFLETPFKRNVGKVQKLIEMRVKNALRNGR